MQVSPLHVRRACFFLTDKKKCKMSLLNHLLESCVPLFNVVFVAICEYICMAFCEYMMYGLYLDRKESEEFAHVWVSPHL